MEVSGLILAVKHKGMSAKMLNTASTIYGAAGFYFVTDSCYPSRGIVLITVEIVYILQTKNALQRLESAIGISTAFSQPPIHMNGLAEIIAQTGNGIYGCSRFRTSVVRQYQP